ncbi:multidrug resistance-associated ABC transporter [Earliella scabrosa]|nr:multidrug resistance-associated ABC transporter [Earliella scabrosa]
MFKLFNPAPAPPAYGHGEVIPEVKASPFSRLFFFWLNPLLSVGFSRPLEKDDLWSLPSKRLTAKLSTDVEKAFYARCPSQERPTFLYETDIDGGDVARQASEAKEEAHVDPQKPEGADATKEKDASPAKEPSLAGALHDVFWRQFWVAGVLNLISDTLNTTTPLVNQVLLTWLTASYVYVRTTDEERAALGLQQPQGIGYGIGLAFAIFGMQQIASFMTNHRYALSMRTGLELRTAIIGAIFRKSLRLSGRARLEHDVGKITTMISADSERLDQNAFTIHNIWIAPIQIAIGIGLLIRNLGPSALVGLGILILGFPIQVILASVMIAQRTKGVAFTDQRVRLSTEVLSGIRLIKYYAWEVFYANKVGSLREQEVGTIVRLAAARSSLIGVVSVIPILATVFSIITYARTGHILDVATIFTSLQLFNIIRAPLVFLPITLASVADAMVALKRISSFLRAEELPVPYTIDPSLDVALDVDGDFTWESVKKADSDAAKPEEKGKADDAKATEDKKGAEAGKGKEQKKGGLFGKKKDAEPVLPSTAQDAEKAEGKEQEKAEVVDVEEEKPFELKDLKLRVPKGAFVAIVGRVGSGKSSVLQALIGEMRKTRGECVFSSTAAYVPQVPWIMNATVRQNILFGQEDNEAKFREIIKACCLERDLEMLPHGEATEIGEKGINLSGGQKARVSLARAAYSGAEIVLMDDSLSAVDSYVGKQILENCLLRGPLADKTRILVTHALHVLDRTDYIYVMDEGVIVEQGTYADLMTNGPLFSRIMEEYGSKEKQQTGSGAQAEKTDETESSAADAAAGGDKTPQALMQDEERAVGAVSWSVYSRYFKFAGGVIVFPIIVFFLALAEGTQVATQLFLGFWTSQSIPGFGQAEYIGIYAGLGTANGVFSFLLAFIISQIGLVAGLRMFKKAFMAVVRSPVSFFDTTPLGRILSRLSKDQDVLDTEVAIMATSFLLTISSTLGTAALVFYTFPYLGIIFLPMIILYYSAAVYYRRSSVEVKRLDALLRSYLYSSYSETLTGLSTVRAYRSQSRFISRSEESLDYENRAYYITIVIQQWLGVRLDIMGNILLLGICLFAAGFRTTVDPSRIGVVMSYTLSVTQVFSLIVTTYAQNEQNFNAVERVLYYTELPSEGDATTPNDPPPSWPDAGAIEFKDVEMAYRPGLPPVLKGVSFEVKPGEKVGIVGRTGAGKSSLLQALFRIVNVQAGTITIDGVDIAKIGLETLRGRLALVPQDSILFKGTLRENLDPLNTRTDAEIIDSLKRALLLPREGPPDPPTEAKFSLDSAVSDEGANYSAGEKQLLALCRALVKNSRIIVLDEATSSVDVETDAKVQRTIQTEFASSTLLCIAHRLNTIVYYDRILVMDDGKVVEFDAPLDLFDKEDSIFRSLCNEANLSREDILKIRRSVQG